VEFIKEFEVWCGSSESGVSKPPQKLAGEEKRCREIGRLIFLVV